MTEVNLSFSDFSAGEISPKIYGRHDLSVYYKSGRRIRNYIVESVGQARYREGTIFANQTRNNNKAYLYTFEISEGVAFVLEFTAGYIRFYRNNGQVRYTAQNITGITKANPAVVTYSGSDTYANGDRVFIEGVGGMTEVNNREFTVANVNTGANTFELSGVNSTSYTTYTSGGTVAEIVEVATPYTVDDLFQLSFAAQSNVLYIAHPSYNPRKLTYTSATSWALTSHSPVQNTFSVSQGITNITKANPAVVTYSGSHNFTNGDTVRITGVSGMLEINDEDYTIANVNPASGVTQSITNITQANPAVVTYAGADTYANGDLVRITGVLGMTQVNNLNFTVANVNTAANTFQLLGIDSTGYTAYSSGGTLEELLPTFELSGVDSAGYTAYSSGGVLRRIISTSASFLSTNEYPAAVGFYEQRLIYGGSNNKPNTLYFSKPALPDNFTIGTAVDDGLSYTIAGSANKIAWLRGTNKFLSVGALGDVYQVTGGIDNVITPESISIRPSNSYGVASINPIGRGSQIFYTQSNKLVIRSFEYDYQQDSYIPIDRNMVADHITKTGVTQLTYQESRPNALWTVRNDGVLAGMTLEESEAVSGWHRHITDGDFISVSSLPRTAQYDQLWFCVKRNINGTDKYYIEYLADEASFPQREDYTTDDETADKTQFNNLMFEAQKEYIHLDSSLSYYGDDNSVTMTPSAVTGASVTFTAGGAFFTASMVGRQIWRKSVTGEETGRAEITGYTSSTVVTCEILEDFDSTTAIPAGEWYLTASEVSGLEHLEGKTVKICADGGQHEERTVSSGTVSLDRQCSVVHVGLGYDGYLETNDLEGGGTTGVAQTKKKSVSAVGFRFWNTLYPRYGISYYNLQVIEQRTANMRMDRPPLPYTGDTKVHFPNHVNDERGAGWERKKRAIVAQLDPYPCYVQLIIPYMSVSN